MTRKRTITTTAALALGAFLAGGGVARATLEMQKQAKAVGAAVQNCLYCHGEKMPKKGASTLNDRGKWLVEQKAAKKAEKIDGAWLKDYVEKGETKK